MNAALRNGRNEGFVQARRLRTVIYTLGLMLGLNRPPSRSRIPASPSRRTRAPVMTGEAPSARAAAVSLRSRASSGARGRAVTRRFPSDRTQGNDAGMVPAAFLKGMNEGTKPCPDISTGCS